MLGQRCPNCGTPTREPEPEAPLPAILGTVWRRGPNEPVPGDSTASGVKPSDSGATPRRLFEVPGFKAPVTSPSSFFRPPPTKPTKPAKSEPRATPTPAAPEAGRTPPTAIPPQPASPSHPASSPPQPASQPASPSHPASQPASPSHPASPPSASPPQPASQPSASPVADADANRPADAPRAVWRPAPDSGPPRTAVVLPRPPAIDPARVRAPTGPSEAATPAEPAPAERPVWTPAAPDDRSGAHRVPPGTSEPSRSGAHRVPPSTPEPSRSGSHRVERSTPEPSRSSRVDRSGAHPTLTRAPHDARAEPGEDDLPTPVVSTRPFSIPRIVSKQRVVVPSVASATHDLDSSAELDLPQILELSNLHPLDTVVATPRAPGTRPDDVEVDLDDLHHEPAPAPPPPAPAPPPAAAEPVTPPPAPRTPPPRPRPLPAPPPPTLPREPTLAARAAVATLALACAGVWWVLFTADAAEAAPRPRILSVETWSEVHALLQARRLDTDRTSDYLQALAEAEAHHDPLGQAEAALCLHLRYGPDPVRSSSAEVWRAQARPGDPRIARVAGLAALADDDFDAAERLLVGDDARTRLYRALTAQRRGDAATAASEANAALAQRPTDVAAELVAVTATLAARRTASLDPLRAAATAHGDHPLYRQALVRALLDRGRLAEARTLADRIDRVTGASEAHQARAIALKAEVAAAGGELSQAVWLFEKAGQLAPQDLPTQLARVRLLLTIGDRLRVQQELTQLARRAPDDPEVLALQAEAAIRSENEAAATRAIDRLAAVGGDRGRVARLRGEVHARMSRVEGAIAAYGVAIEHDPGDVAAVLALAGLRLRSGEPRGGGPSPLADLDVTRQLLQSDPRAAVRPRLRALAVGHADLLVETGRKDQAIGVLDAALAADPDDNAAQLRRGVLAIEQGRVAAGRADLAAVAERTGGYPGLAESLGRLYLRDNELVLLAALVQPHLADPRASDEVLVMGGLLRLAQGEVDAAEALIDRVLLRSGSMWEARLAKARVLYTRGRLAEALAEVRLARPREPDAEVELWTGKILARLGKPQEAAAAFRKANQLDPSLHEASFLHGRALLEQGLAREAILELADVVAATDAFPAAFITLGLAHRERDQNEQALSYFLRAALLDPGSGEAAYWAGRTRVELGRPADALYHLRRAVLSPEPGAWQADAHLWLARALIKQGQRDEAASMYATYLRIAGPRASARAEAEKLTRGR